MKKADEKYANVKWEELGFPLTPTDYMYVTKRRQGESFLQGKIVPYGEISISPCSPILNYGQDPLIDINFNNPSWKGNWSQLCPTWKKITSVRSKHCPTCKHCIEQFDHHCPWISNCVGKKNKRDFLVFLILGALTSSIGGTTTIHRLWTNISYLHPTQPWIQFVVIEHPGAAVFLFSDFFIFIATITLTISQAYQAEVLSYDS